MSNTIPPHVLAEIDQIRKNNEEVVETFLDTIAKRRQAGHDDTMAWVSASASFENVMLNMHERPNGTKNLADVFATMLLRIEKLQGGPR